MLCCDFDFDFAEAHIEKRWLVSYALIPNEDYQAAICREYVILVENNVRKK